MKILLIAIIIAALFTGCRSDIPSGKERIDIRGRITGVISGSPDMHQAHRVQGFIQVEGKLTEDVQYDKAAITITDSTRIHIMSGNEKKEGTFGSLKENDSVEAVFTGPVRESYPVQATALQITILGR